MGVNKFTLRVTAWHLSTRNSGGQAFRTIHSWARVSAVHCSSLILGNDCAVKFVRGLQEDADLLRGGAK
jgi:hypothetical protein